MKRLISLGAAVALMLVPLAASVLAADGDTRPAPFHALSALSPGESTALTPLTDDQLASVVGAARKTNGTNGTNVAVCAACFALQITTQLNISVLSFDVEQENENVQAQGSNID
jgi:hypothetical protein